MNDLEYSYSIKRTHSMQLTYLPVGEKTAEEQHRSYTEKSD